MQSTTPRPAAPPRPEIASSWARSRLSGLREDGAPRLAHGSVAAESGLVRAAGPVLERAKAELDGAPVGLVLANHTAHVVDVQFADRSAGRAIADLGIAPGVQLGEDQVGTNAIGTPLETKRELLVRGPDHFIAAFRSFTCYGHPIIHPIIHPITRRLEGVLDIGDCSGEENRLFPPLLRRMVRDIEDRLQLGSTRAQRRLLAEFQVAARQRGRPVIVVGQSLVLATPHAIDLLEPADHAAVRTCAEVCDIP
ncbi:hypothetical protein AB0I53_43075 [Saccharopolyspora sp. NPDC050389]|uniref:hypothetical protein n=1 Tax=Saccharopolyspora sp. NPDC050389 TaxID=3155516 RepID=UPI0033F7BAAF